MNQVHGNTVEFIDVHGQGPPPTPWFQRSPFPYTRCTTIWPSWWPTACPWFSWGTVPIGTRDRCGPRGPSRCGFRRGTRNCRGNAQARSSGHQRLAGPVHLRFLLRGPANMRAEVAAGSCYLVGHLLGYACLGPSRRVSGPSWQPWMSPWSIRGCTLENNSLFSYRRDSRTGRFAGLVWTHD